jgi:hypothetical protein
MEECDCGCELDLLRCDLVKYGMQDCEEMVGIYECSECKRTYTQREGDYDLELMEED